MHCKRKNGGGGGKSHCELHRSKIGILVSVVRTVETPAEGPQLVWKGVEHLWKDSGRKKVHAEGPDPEEARKIPLKSS